MIMKNIFTGITHCSFYCKDFEKMLSFYRDTLEIPAIFTLRNEDGSPWLTYLKVADRQFLELFNELYEGDNNWAKLSFSHMSLLVEDIFSAVRMLESKGVLITKGPSAMRNFLRVPYISDHEPGACGSLTAWFQDPEGNEIELMQYTPVSMQVVCNIN
jgi:catechol 2,3-dioxygenase-like lactoylglutathione lyase family enzyme